MSDHRNDQMLDELDSTLAGFLRWRAEGARGLPSVDVMTERVMGRTGARREPSTWRLALVATALLAVLLAALWIGTGTDHSLLAVGPTSSAPASSRPIVVPTGTPGPTGPCLDGRTQLRPGAGTAVPSGFENLKAPANTRIATEAFESPIAGSVLVADAQVGTARVVATFTGSDVQQGIGVRVLAWSPAGDELLVDAGHLSPPVADRNCDNLFLVRADGSAVARLTDYGPQQSIDTAEFAPNGDVLYGYRGTLHRVGSDGADQRVLAPLCDSPLWGLQWSPDQARFAVPCGARVAVVDVGLQTVGYVDPESPGFVVLAAGWTGLDSLVIAAADNRATNALVSVDFAQASPAANGTTYRPAISSDEQADWVLSTAMFSSDHRWLLIVGAGTVASDYFPTYLIDSRTGASTRMPWQLGGFNATVSWLAAGHFGGPRVAAWDNGKLYAVDLLAQQRTFVTPLPDQAFSLFQLPG